MIKINKTLGANYNVDLNDVQKIKTALNILGYYKVPDYGMTPYPDTDLFRAVQQFQKKEQLKVDGVIKPDGETLQALNRKLPNENPDVRRPDMRCPQCGGWHGGSMGDLCPDCTSK